MKLDIKQKGRPSIRNRSLIKLLNLPAIMVSGISTLFLPSHLDDLSDRLNSILQEKQARINSELHNEKILAPVDKIIRKQMHIYKTK